MKTNRLEHGVAAAPHVGLQHRCDFVDLAAGAARRAMMLRDAREEALGWKQRFVVAVVFGAMGWAMWAWVMANSR